MATRTQLHDLIERLPEDQVDGTLDVLDARAHSGDPSVRSQALIDAVQRFHELADELPSFDALQAATEARYELEGRALEL